MTDFLLQMYGREKMNKRVVRFLALCLPVVLLFAGCRFADQTLVPATDVEDIPIPAMVELARENVLEYVISSSRLAVAPSGTDWQLYRGSNRKESTVFAAATGSW